MKAKELAELLLQHPECEVVVTYTEVEGDLEGIYMTSVDGAVTKNDIELKNDKFIIDNRY